MINGPFLVQVRGDHIHSYYAYPKLSQSGKDPIRLKRGGRNNSMAATHRAREKEKEGEGALVNAQQTAGYMQEKEKDNNNPLLLINQKKKKKEGDQFVG